MKAISQLVFATLLGATCSAAYAAGTDDLWEMNISINSGGHSMPLQTMQNCMLKGQNHPTPSDKTCKVSTNQGGLIGKGGMVMECAGPPPYTVKIEGTRTATTMKGTMTVISGGTTMVQDFAGKIIGACDAATFDPKAGMSQGGGMPGMNMPSFTHKPRPPQQSSNDAAPPNAANEAGDPAQKDTNEQAKDNSNTSMDLAKKALGGLLHF